MRDVAERVVFLETRIEEQVMKIDDVREALVSLEQRMDRRFERIEAKLDAIDGKFGQVYRLLVAMLIAIVGGMSGIIAAIVTVALRN